MNKKTVYAAILALLAFSLVLLPFLLRVNAGWLVAGFLVGLPLALGFSLLRNSVCLFVFSFLALVTVWLAWHFRLAAFAVGTLVGVLFGIVMFLGWVHGYTRFVHSEYIRKNGV
ncbi:MAG: hypothetical protein E4H01_01540 [Lysobacterales bacterium]|nr:MAG: hypothetical protein E4H01_01540 [Xanthomonadales bacterium]